MNIKQLISTTIITVLIIGSIPFAGAQQWYSAAYNNALNKGYLEGMNFVADKPVTRGELIALLMRTDGYKDAPVEILENNDGRYYFDDHKPGDPFFAEVALAKERRIITGTNNCIQTGARPCNINASDNINRAATAKLLNQIYNAWRNVEADVIMPDVPEDQWYHFGMQQLANACVLQGGGDGNFYPNNNIIWAEIVVMLQRIEQNMRAPNCTPGSNETNTVLNTNNGTQPTEPTEYEANLVEQYLVTGRIQDGIEAALLKLQKFENSATNKDDLVLGLGILRLVDAFKNLANNLYDYGAGNMEQQLMVVPIFRMPVEPNPNPKLLTHNRFEKIIEQFNSDIAQVEKVLKDIDSDVSMMIPVHKIKFDMNNSGTVEDSETLMNVISATMGGVSNQPFYVNFDRGDVHWLRGYSNFMLAFSDTLLAHDTKDLFNKTGHLFFPNTDTPYTFLTNSVNNELFGFVDLITVIHEINWDVKDKNKLKVAHSRLLTMMDESLTSWHFIEQETDDNFEWIPNANQSSQIGMDLSQEMIDTWKATLTETKSIINGEKLVPFWRDESQGINVRKVFYEPTALDIVGWIQGSSAWPYLQTGTMTDKNFWQNLQEVFRYNLVEFALYLN